MEISFATRRLYRTGEQKQNNRRALFVENSGSEDAAAVTTSIATSTTQSQILTEVSTHCLVTHPRQKQGAPGEPSPNWAKQRIPR